MGFLVGIAAKAFPFRWYVIGGAFALVCGAWLVQTLRVNVLRADLASAISLRALEREIAAENALHQAEEYRAEEQRRVKAIQGIVNDTIQKAEAVAADAADSRAAADRLRQRVAAIVAANRQAAPSPAASEGSPPAPDAVGMLAELYRRLDEIAQLYAGVADATHNAGHACERAYNEVSK
jgi:hypothetical protein